MAVLHRARLIVNRLGLDIGRLSATQSARQAQLLATHAVGVVFDAGANCGGFALELRRFGFRGRIISFEPLDGAYASLKKASASDPLWTVRRVALGSEAGEATLNVAGNLGASSSLLPMLDRHQDSAPEASYVAREATQVVRLDDIWEDLASASDRPFLKLDVQGYEREVLSGAADLLRHCVGVQMELSFVPLYEGGMLYEEAFAIMKSTGFTLQCLLPGFTDERTGQMLQADGVFFR